MKTTTILKLLGVAFYLLLAWAAITGPVALAASASQAMLVLIAVAHLVQCVIYRSLIRQVPGSRAWHLLNVFFFGVAHVLEMKRAVRDDQE